MQFDHAGGRMITNSLIIPFYNEEAKIVPSLNKLLEFAKQQQRGWEILIVDDGSNDNTLDILKNFKPNFFEIISYSNNKGKGYAIKTAISSASGKYAGFTDGDIPYSFEDVKNAFDVVKECDIVVGSRKLADKNSVKTTALRKLTGKSFNILSRLILNYNFKDTQCGLKVFNKQSTKEIFKKQTINGFSFDTELLFLAKKMGLNIREIPATLSEDHSYKNSKINIIRDSSRMFLDLLTIKKNELVGKYV